jgi:hypothetical protein
MTIGAVHIMRASFFSTHHASPGDVLADRERPFTAPAYSLLAGRARRFTSLVTQMHIEVCGALQIDAADPPTAVFATCHGEIQTAEKLLADFRDNAMVSSARFALSVHNSPSGVYSVATGSTAPTTTVTGANALAAGWLEAALTALDTGVPVLLSIADEPVPEIFHGPTTQVGVAAAFLLAPSPASGGRRVELAITGSTDDAVDALRVLARAAEAAQGSGRSGADAGARSIELGLRPATVALGHIRPGAGLELRFAEARA